MEHDPSRRPRGRSRRRRVIDARLGRSSAGALQKKGDRQPETAPERYRGEEDNAPSRDWIKRLADFIFQSLRLGYSVVPSVIGGLNTAPQRVTSHQVPPVLASPRGP